MEKAAPETGAAYIRFTNHAPMGPQVFSAKGLALARLKPAVGFVDYIGATTTTNHAVVAVTVFKRFQRVANFHGTDPPFLTKRE